MIRQTTLFTVTAMTALFTMAACEEGPVIERPQPEAAEPTGS